MEVSRQSKRHRSIPSKCGLKTRRQTFSKKSARNSILFHHSRADFLRISISSNARSATFLIGLRCIANKASCLPVRATRALLLVLWQVLWYAYMCIYGHTRVNTLTHTYTHTYLYVQIHVSPLASPVVCLLTRRVVLFYN